MRTLEASSQALRMLRQVVRIHCLFSRWLITWSTDDTVSSSTYRHGWKKKQNYENSSKVEFKSRLKVVVAA